ncbi:MAG TPA: ABC transporter permease [Candidatus Cloacimonadota bacterium]|nr:ABC transporter permease [Candidatus Cloacimonadota bacterium]
MVLGIVISVCTLTAALSLFDGYTHSLEKSMLGANSHLYIYPNVSDELTTSDTNFLSAYLKKQPQIKAYSFIIMKPAMLSANDKVKGCVIHGIDWNSSNPTTNYQNYVQQGSYKLDKPYEIVIGEKLAEELNISIGDSVQILRPKLQTGMGVGIIPQSETFKVVGLYHSGMYEYDNSYIFMDRKQASAFFQMKENTSMVEIRLKDHLIRYAERFSIQWATELQGRYQVMSWMYFSQSLFSLLTMERWMIFIILTFLLLIATFNVISALLTLILEKRKEIGILKTMGSNDSLLKRIFYGKVVVLGIGSIIVGELAGIALALIVAKQTVFHLKADVYFMEQLTVQFSAFNLVLIFIVSFIIITLGTMIPLRKINHLSIIEILREG